MHALRRAGRQRQAEVPFRIGADRWRVWSSKKLDRVWLGEWTAKVVADDGTVLASETFRYAAAAPTPRGAGYHRLGGRPKMGRLPPQTNPLDSSASCGPAPRDLPRRRATRLGSLS
jgi:hypothetical protein